MQAPRRLGIAILAAGDGTRMGAPKALCRCAGTTFLDHILASVAALEVHGYQTSCVLVVGQAHAAVCAHLANRAPLRFPLEVVANRDVARERTHSLRIAVQALPPDRPQLIWPVDVPLVPAASVMALCRSPLQARSFRIPTADRRGGHPVLLSHDLRSDVLALRDEQSLRDLHHAARVHCERVDVSDPRIHFDLDTPADIKRAEAWLQQHSHA